MGTKWKRNRSFWGIEITKSNPVTHRFDKARGKLRVTQASFRATSEYRCCSVLCSVGNETPMALCILNGEMNKSCPLDIEFDDEDTEVQFSVDHDDVYGNQEMRVHLTGYYFDECCDCGSSDNKVTVNKIEDHESKAGLVKLRTTEVKTITEYAYPSA